MILITLDRHCVVMGQGAHVAAVAGEAVDGTQICYVVLNKYRVYKLRNALFIWVRF